MRKQLPAKVTPLGTERMWQTPVHSVLAVSTLLVLPPPKPGKKTNGQASAYTAQAQRDVSLVL